MKRIIWTRPAEDWAQDQKIVKLDLPVLRFPVTKQVCIPPQLPPKPCEVVLLTSRKAAEGFLGQTASIRDQLHKAEFVTFGMETYKFLVSQNLKARLIPVQNGKDFAHTLAAEMKKGPVVWFPRPAEPAFAIGDHLRAHNLEVHDIEMYRTEPIKHFEPEAMKKLCGEPSVVCFASPSTVKAFVDLIRSQDEARFYKFTAVVIGGTTLTSAQGYFPDVFQAAHPTLQSLWDKALEIARQETTPGKE
ncbi:uroporphyrinogen-III synthase [Oligoflexus tunisiensis]|uniref:uroporphyrinogen-III synthase n=1 Tax=Oligoflexus tunisiensis TaxID=708132 RepID=UPI00114CA282|nr:uroporphyrinogen-III synthase [Oligoflexus tunisiensis]